MTSRSVFTSVLAAILVVVAIVLIALAANDWSHAQGSYYDCLGSASPEEVC